MPEAKFCYEVHEDAGLSHDEKTGEKVKSYITTTIETNRALTNGEYAAVHTDGVIQHLSQQLNIDMTHFKPISIEEFNAILGE